MKNQTIMGLGALLLSLGMNVVLAASSDASVYDGWLKPGPPPMERFVKPLALTAAQQKQLKPIFADAQAKAAQDQAANVKEKSANPETVGSTMNMREADLRLRLSTVLTPEQMANYERLTAAQAANVRTLNPHPAHGHSDMSTTSASPGEEPKPSETPAPAVQ